MHSHPSAPTIGPSGTLRSAVRWNPIRLGGCSHHDNRQANLPRECGRIDGDDHGTAIITESCFINDNRNPGLGIRDCEEILRELFGLRRMIWLPGVRGKDITDGHTDFYARFARQRVVVAALETDRQSFDYRATRENLKILEAARDADGRKLEVITLESLGRIRRELETDDFAAGYINYYVANGAVIAPEFGDARTDSRCRHVLQRLSPVATSCN